MQVIYLDKADFFRFVFRKSLHLSKTKVAANVKKYEMKSETAKLIIQFISVVFKMY